MTKEERLASVGLTNTPEGVAAFYDMFPDMESHDNYMANGGSLSGAPHDGQPTADQFFNYGSHANDGINIPMSNPFYAANGGTPYYGGPVRPYQKGGTSDYDNKYKEARKQDSTYYDPQYDVMDMFSTGSFDNYDAIDVAKKYGYVGGFEDFSKKQKELYDNPVRLGMIEGQEAAYRAYQKGKHKPVSLSNDQIMNLGKLYEQYGDSWETNSPMYGTAKFNFKENLSPYDYQRVKSMGEWYKEKHKKYGGYMDMGGNMASPTNYGAFNVPMQAGGILDPGNNQDYPILEEGGKANLMAMIKAHSKKMRKAYEDGGDTVMQGGNSDDYPDEIKTNFIKGLKKNLYNHMVNEEEQAFSKEFMQMGGYQGQGMNYNTTTFNDVDPQNEAIRDMYKQRIAHYDTDLKNSFGNLSNSMYNLKHTANPYTQTSVSYAADGGTLPQAKYGDWDFSTEYQKSKRTNELRKALEDKKRVSMSGVSDEQLEKMAREEGLISDRDISRDDSNNDYNRYFKQSKRGSYNLPMNYNPYNKISRKDVAMLQELAKNPTTNLKEFKHSHFGPWGRTKMTFGYKDQSPFTENKQDPIQVDLKNNPNDFDFQKEAGFDQPGPRAWNQYKEEDPMQGFIPKRIMLDSIFNTQNFPNNTSNQQNVDPEIEEFNKNNSSNNNDLKSGMPEYDNRNTEPYNSSLLQNMLKINPYSRVKYGGLTRAQYGLDHKSTNPADGTYDNFGNPIGLSSATGNMGLTSNPISMGTSFQPVGNAPGAAPSSISYQGTNAPAFSTPESVGIQQQNTEMKGMRGSERQATITSKQRPGFNGMAAADSIIAGIDTATSLINKARDTSKQKLSTLQLADNAFLANTSNAQSQGDYDPNSGMFRPNKMVPVQFPGYNAAYGGAMYQEGGMQDQAQAQPDPQQVMQGVAQMLQQGAQPEQVAQQLVKMGIPQEQVMKIIQAVMQQLQGDQEEQEQPAMRYGGYAMGGSSDDEESYEDDLDEDEIAELKRQGYNIEYLD
jgi:hypothetical protein